MRRTDREIKFLKKAAKIKKMQMKAAEMNNKNDVNRL